MGAPSKNPLSNDVMIESGQRPRRHATSHFHAFLRAALLHLALVAAFACVAQPALARVVMKKGVFGAIALQRETGQLGYAYDAATSRAAKIDALKQCAHPRCEVVASFSNACGALARGPKKYFPATGAVRQEAETKALRLCAARECEIVAWACTK
jgi:serine/threonine-protein kinase